MFEGLRETVAGILGSKEAGLGFEPDDTLAAVLQEVHNAMGPGLSVQMVDAALREGSPQHPDDLTLIAYALTGDEPTVSLLHFLDLRNSAINPGQSYPGQTQGTYD